MCGRRTITESVTVTTSVPVQITLAAPGLYAAPGPGAAPAHRDSLFQLRHRSDLHRRLAHAGDTVTVSIEDRQYNYAVTATDTISISGSTIRDALVALINSNGDEKVIATASGLFSRIILERQGSWNRRGRDRDWSSVVGQTTTNATTLITSTSSPRKP